jgi:EF-hand domain-containing protein 1
MTSIYPKVPGYCYNHDPTKVDFKKVSAHLLTKIQNNELKPKQQIVLPRQIEQESIKVRDGPSLSFSQETYTNHFGSDISEHFQPDWVKLDKQVLRFFGYFKESIVELKVENARIRKLVIFYYLVDDTISINEERETNSGIVQGPFLKRGKVKKGDESYFNWRDLKVGEDILMYGKYIKLYDCDDYTREYFDGIGITQQSKQEIPIDNFHLQNINKVVPKKDQMMKDYLEHRLGGGRVQSQKQFLENDRKVLRFNAKYDSLKYIIHYYLADDSVEIREMHNTNRYFSIIFNSIFLNFLVEEIHFPSF